MHTFSAKMFSLLLVHMHHWLIEARRDETVHEQPIEPNERTYERWPLISFNWMCKTYAQMCVCFSLSTLIIISIIIISACHYFRISLSILHFECHYCFTLFSFFSLSLHFILVFRQSPAEWIAIRCFTPSVCVRFLPLVLSLLLTKCAACALNSRAEASEWNKNLFRRQIERNRKSTTLTHSLTYTHIITKKDLKRLIFLMLPFSLRTLSLFSPFNF